MVAVQGDGSIKDHPAIVTVTGAVNRPGPIIVSQGMRLSDAVREAGGLRPEAFPQGSEFTRTADTQITTGQFGLAQIISQMSDMLNLTQYQRERARVEPGTDHGGGHGGQRGGQRGHRDPRPHAGAGSSANPNVAPLVNNLTQNNLVSQGRILTPSQLQPNGSVAVRLADALKRPGGTEDVLIKDGDTLVVPETPTTVQVVGAVFSPSGVVFRPGQSIDYYIKYAGGFTPDAADDRIEVIHAGGGLIPASKAGAIQPGDLILVPTKVLAEKVSRSGGGFSAFFQGLVGSAITLKVLSSVFGLLSRSSPGIAREGLPHLTNGTFYAILSCQRRRPRHKQDPRLRPLSSPPCAPSAHPFRSGGGHPITVEQDEIIIDGPLLSRAFRRQTRLWLLLGPLAFGVLLLLALSLDFPLLHRRRLGRHAAAGRPERHSKACSAAGAAAKHYIGILKSREMALQVERRVHLQQIYGPKTLPTPQAADALLMKGIKPADDPDGLLYVSVTLPGPPRLCRRRPGPGPDRAGQRPGRERLRAGPERVFR